jgi:hypothetical protein
MIDSKRFSQRVGSLRADRAPESETDEDLSRHDSQRLTSNSRQMMVTAGIIIQGVGQFVGGVERALVSRPDCALRTSSLSVYTGRS